MGSKGYGEGQVMRIHLNPKGTPSLCNLFDFVLLSLLFHSRVFSLYVILHLGEFDVTF